MSSAQRFGLTLLVVLALVASGSFASAALVSQYKFEEGAGLAVGDSIGAAHLAVMNNATPGWTTGKIGAGAMTFNGADWAEAVGNPLNNSTSFSVAWWMNTTQGDKDAGIISSDDNASRRLMIWRNGAAVYATGHVTGLETTNYLNDGQWHHYTLTKENNVAWNIYRDGVQVDTSAVNTAFTQGNGNFRLARHGNDSASARWPGSLDDLGLWNEVVTPQRVALIHGLGKFSNVDAGSTAIGDVLTAFTAGPESTAMAGSDTWRYASATQLNNPAGTVGLSGIGTVGAPYIVLDSSGNGVVQLDTTHWAQIGPGTSIPHETVDGANGPRTNVDEGYSRLLTPGRYSARDFTFAFGQTGSVTPFLARLVGTDQYEVLAVGDTVAVTGSGAMSVVFGGSDFFELDSMTRIYAGIVSPPGSNNPVRLDDGTSPFLTDHHGNSLAVSPVGVLLSGFSNPNLGRSYAFSITVQAVPEPAACWMAALGMGLLALVAGRKRRAR